MTSKLDYVRKGQTISANAWNELVERVNALERRPSFDFLVPQKQKPTISLALFAITWNWALDANGVAFASASPVDTQPLDVSQDVVTVYAPNGTGDGAAANVEWRWCVWRGRWELVEKKPAEPDPTLYSQSVITNLMVNVSNDRLVISIINETIHYYGDEN